MLKPVAGLSEHFYLFLHTLSHIYNTHCSFILATIKMQLWLLVVQSPTKIRMEKQINSWLILVIKNHLIIILPDGILLRMPVLKETGPS